MEILSQEPPPKNDKTREKASSYLVTQRCTADTTTSAHSSLPISLLIYLQSISVSMKKFSTRTAGHAAPFITV